MAGWHHQCNEHELGQTPGDDEGQGGLACCSPWGCKELEYDWATEQLLFPSVSKVCSLCLHLYSYPANRFISTIFSRFCTYVLIYEIGFSLSDLLHSV